MGSPISAKQIIIPIPGANYTKKSNVVCTESIIFKRITANSLQPSPLGPIDHLHRAPTTGDRNLGQQRKKRVGDGHWELTGSNGKRQNTNNRSRGRGKSAMETQGRGSHETNQTTISGANRNSTARLKSEQLKEGLAGGSTTINMKDIRKEGGFSIPHDHHQAWRQKMLVRNGMILDAADSEDEGGLHITGGHIIPLTSFRRGRIVLGDKTRVSVLLDPHGKFNVYEGGIEREEYGFLLVEVKFVYVRSVILLGWDSVLRLVIDEQH